MSSPKHHALLSASSAHRWLSAPPLPRLEQYFPHSTSSAATEGTAAHALGEYKIHRLLGDKFERPVSDYQSDEMESLTDDYASYVIEQYNQAKEFAPDATIRVEQKLNFSKYVPEGLGTGDCVIVSDHLLHIIDFKYGKGVRVEAPNNPQMKLYAIGAQPLWNIFREVQFLLYSDGGVRCEFLCLIVLLDYIASVIIGQTFHFIRLIIRNGTFELIAEKLSDVDPKDYEDLYYNAEGLGQ